MKTNVNFINFLLVVLLALVLLVNVFTLSGLDKALKTAPVVVDTTGADTVKIALTGIEPTDCAKCANLSQIIDALESSGTITLTSTTVLKADDPKAKALIAKYKFTRLPAIIFEGDIAKLPASPQVEKVGNALLLRQLPPPFYDLQKNAVGGIVDVTYLTADTCDKCTDITNLGTQLSASAVTLGTETTLAYDSVEGKALMDKYNITAVPTAIFSADAGEYSLFVQAWKTAGTIAPDGSYVLTQLTPPYLDTTTGNVRGSVKATYLSDASCTTCFNASMFQTILGQNFGMSFDDESELDIASSAGKDLVQKYNITEVPTVILTGDTIAYKGLVQAWAQVGTTEKDGAMVFRKLSLLQGMAYKDLSSGKIITTPATALPTE